MLCPNCGKEVQVHGNFCSFCGSALDREATGSIDAITSFLNEGTTGAIRQTIRYAGFWRRFVAFLIDYTLLIISYTLIFILFFMLYSDPSQNTLPEIPNWVSLLALLITWFYFTLMESSKSQATIGKWIIGLKVTDSEGNRISFGKASVRFFSKILSSIILFLGFIAAGFTKKKQALHDTMADCLILRSNQKLSGGAIFVAVLCFIIGFPLFLGTTGGPILIPSMIVAQLKAKTIKCKAEMRYYVVSLESFYLDNVQYPQAKTSRYLQDSFLDTGSNEKTVLINLTSPVAYVAEITRDPFDKDKMGYRYYSSQDQFVLVSNGPDEDIDFDERTYTDNPMIFQRHLFDATNGIYSNGDIIAIKSGIY